MKRSNRLVILVGVLLAVLAFVGIVILLNNSGSTTERVPTTAKVLVAKQAVAIGTPVTPDLVDVKEVPLTAVSGTSFSDPSQLGGRPALVAVPVGGQVSQETVGAGQAVNNISSQLKPGEKAISFQVDRTTGLDFLVQRGDTVDVVLSQEITVLQPATEPAGTPAGAAPRFEVVSGLEKVRTVKTVLQNKRVLYVSVTRTQAAAQPTATPVPGAAAAQAQVLPESVIVVVAGTDQDAELIKFAQKDQTERGSLTVTVRATADTAVEKTGGITIDKLVKDYGLVIPGIVRLPVTKP